jgi:DNA repair protein RadC
VIRSALINNASSIIVCHNHPSGDPHPSEADKEITRILVNACEMVGIPVLDHVIIGKKEHYSFADEGLMESYTIQAKETLGQASINF